MGGGRRLIYFMIVFLFFYRFTYTYNIYHTTAVIDNNYHAFVVCQNGTYSSLPYLAMWVFSMVASHIADMMISSERFTHTVTRKIVNSIGKDMHNNNIIFTYTFDSSGQGCVIILRDLWYNHAPGICYTVIITIQGHRGIYNKWY